ASNMFEIDGLVLEKLRVALCVRLTVYESAQACLWRVLIGVVLVENLEDADLRRNGLAGRELDLNARALFKTLFELVFAPRGETVPDGVLHNLGAIVRAALDKTQRQYRLQQVFF